MLNRILGSLKDKKGAILSGVLTTVVALSSVGLIHVDPSKLQAVLMLLGVGSVGASVHDSTVGN